MKRFRIKEKYIVTQWTYVSAYDADEAQAKLDAGFTTGEDEINKEFDYAIGPIEEI